MSRGVRRLAWLVLPSAAAGLLVLAALPRVEGQAGKEELAVQARAILKANCYGCHGDPAKPLKGKKLNLFDPACYLDKDRKIVVPGDADASKLIQRIEDEEDNRMPPPDKGARLSKADAKLLRDWIAAGAPAYSGQTTEAPAPTDTLPSQAEKILKARCYGCHGDPARPLKKKLNLFDSASYLDKTRKVVVPGDSAASRLIQRIDDDDSPMPPKGERVPDAERKVLRDWITAGAPAFTTAVTVKPKGGETGSPTVPAVPATTVAAADAPSTQVSVLFRDNCSQCHSGSKPEASFHIDNRGDLLSKKLVVPGAPDQSPILKRVQEAGADRMPPEGDGRRALKPEEIEAVRQWIAAGAPEFEEFVKVADNQVGEEYVLGAILQDVRRLEAANERLQNYRYFSLNHLLAGQITARELDEHRQALALIINHLSRKESLEIPEPIDKPLNTVFRVDITRLGWDKRPYQRKDTGAAAGLNLFDLVLLEYPYGTIYDGSTTYLQLVNAFLRPVRQVRPVAYVRADWFVNVAARPPLYEDLLQLPFTLDGLEKQLGVTIQDDVKSFRARRAGMAVSGVSRNNRIVERHEPDNAPYLWMSYDYRSNKGPENMLQNPVDLNPAGGEMIFGLPNGLQGYYVATGRGARLDAAPTEIVVDDMASDRTVRNGFSCMRCHEAGMRTFHDDMRAALSRLPSSPPDFDKLEALRLYPPQAEMDKLVAHDGQRYVAALHRLFGTDLPPIKKVLNHVSARFLDRAITGRGAAEELGLPGGQAVERSFQDRDLAAAGLMALASGGAVRRDTWEDVFDQVAEHFSRGTTVVPLDGATRADYRRLNSAVSFDVATNRKTFKEGDALVITVKNRSRQPIFIEMVMTGTVGQKLILTPDVTEVAAGGTFRFPPDARKGIKINGLSGKEQVTVYACDTKFEKGELLVLPEADEAKGLGMAARVVHRQFYRLPEDAESVRPAFDAGRVVKKTVAIETQ